MILARALRLLSLGAVLLTSSWALAQTTLAPPPAAEPALTPPPPPPPMPPPGYEPQLYPQQQQQAYPQPIYAPQRVLGPARLRAVPGQPPPDGYHEDTENSPGLIVAGAITFGVTWAVFNLFPGLLASSLGCTECGFLMIPVVGPAVLGIATNASLNSGVVSLLVIDTIVQAGGMAMLIAGLVMRNPIWVRDYRPVSVVPILTPGMQGLAVSGSF